MSELHNIQLRPGKLTLDDCIKVLQADCLLTVDENDWQEVEASCDCVNSVLANGQTVYGINTGFGLLANTNIASEKLALLQKNLVLSHATGTGEDLDEATVRLIMLLKINSLLRGYSGVRRHLVEYLIKLFNHRCYPVVPAKGSVGASGDLVPLAHLVVPLLGEGHFNLAGNKVPASEGLRAAGLSALTLAPKEGLALLNGMQVSNAIALKALVAAKQSFLSACASGALSVEAALGSRVPFDARIHHVRGHLSQIQVAKLFEKLLKNSEINDSHQACHKVQDPYSLRCQPQVMGAVLHQLDFVEQTLMVEANAVTDNPIVFSKENEFLSGGNFHGEILAMSADNLALGIAEIGALSERRIALLIDANISGLPPFLVKEGGLNSGFMLAHVTAASCASDNKALAHPHCVDSLPTSANQEDHVSMATNAALRLTPMLDNVATILALELLAACQGVEFRRPLKTSPVLEQVIACVREKVDFYDKDRYFAPDLALIKQLVLDGEVARLIDKETS